MFIINKLDTEQRVRIAAALVDGVGVNATCRMTGEAKHTVLKRLDEVGEACVAILPKDYAIFITGIKVCTGE
jgi:hypothetical protein